MTHLSDPLRINADLRSSEAADAVGLSYRHSRARLWRILKGIEQEPPPSNRLKYCFEQGQLLEPFALAAYNDVFGRTKPSKTYQFTLKTSKKRKREEEDDERGYKIAATPDAECIQRTHLIEIKNVIDDKELPSGPKPAHIIQCVLQMRAARVWSVHLFYYKALTGEYVCFKLNWDDDLYQHHIKEWLLEWFSFTEREPPRAPNGLKEEREHILKTIIKF